MTSFLNDDSSPAARWSAISGNQVAWIERNSVAAQGEVHRAPGLLWTRTQGSGEIALTGEAVPLAKDQIDLILDWYRGQEQHASILFWCLVGPTPGYLQPRLLARGFQLNWQPHWMWLDLRQLVIPSTTSDGVTVELVRHGPDWQVDDLPYYNSADSRKLATLMEKYPEHVFHFVARQQDRVVGQCVLNITTGEAGVAGFYNVGVVPSARRRGIGTALMAEACSVALQAGCRYAMLNSTGMGEALYRRVGFKSLGLGHTWYMPAEVLVRPKSAPQLVDLVEAIGLGDVAALDGLGNGLAAEELAAPLPNGMTPLDVAVACHQPATASWLVAHGAPLDIIAAWDLSWNEQIPDLLARQPELVNLQRGSRRTTPLHVAVERNDVELAQLLLTAPVDLSILDGQFKATALDWARHLGRTELVALIAARQG